MFHKLNFFRAVSAVENLDVFTITKKMGNLSLDDKNTSSSSNLSLVSRSDVPNTMPMFSSTSSILERFKRSSKHSEFTRKVMDLTKSPFMDIPKTVMDLTSNSASYLLSLGFRFMPGQGEFLFKNLRLPDTLDGLKGLRENLGLTLAKDTLTNRGILKFKGLSEIHAKGSLMMNRVLLEAITYNDGFYGRFLVLAQIGVGCTVWYGFTPGDGFNIPFDASLTSLFSPIENYEPFFYNPDVYIHPGFQKMTLMENQANTISALSTAYTDEKPFLDIKIPTNSNSNLIVGITLGLVVVVLLSVGLSPIAE
ncbi:unnamed protein product [Coffea canephora]|uniref:DH200=94 genomic scaffold, scaffold_159 n=1 Tax=Coffea canephora TaxID=49390 RepID=A0A068VCK2_COFCA|nr:unnamed protein product [Coffea canephora]